MYSEETGQSIHIQLSNIGYIRFEHASQYSNINSSFSRMYLITEGEGKLAIGNEIIKLEAGHLYLIPGFTTCEYLFNKGLAHIYIHFNLFTDNGINPFNLVSTFTKVEAMNLDIQLFYRLLEINPNRELPHRDPSIYQTKPWINKKCLYENMGQHLETVGIIKQLFSRFLKAENNISMSSFQNYKMQSILTYIHLNLQNDISMETLASIAYISKDHFARIFKSIIGIAPCEYIIKKRLEKAQFLLLTSNLTQQEIVENTNFKSVSYFCRMFKKHTSFTPSEYRKQRSHPI